MATTINLEYPAPPGNKPFVLVDIDGPASYTAITPGTPITGGQEIIVTPSGMGLNRIEWAQSMGDSTGTYDVVCYVSPFNRNNNTTTLILQWLTAATGAEVAGATNLSGSVIRVLMIGRF